MDQADDGSLRLKVSEGLGKDVGRALARMDPACLLYTSPSPRD